MVVRRSKAYIGPEEQIDTILPEVEKHFTLSGMRASRLSYVYYDTFDWRLYAKGYLLKRRGKNLILSDLTGKVMAKASTNASKDFFWWELEDEALQELLRPICGIRAMSEILTMKISRQRLDLLNRDRKIVVRLSIDNCRALGNERESDLAVVVTAEEVRGYEKPFARAVNIIADRGLQELSDGVGIIHYALKAVEREPLDYSPKYNLFLPQNITLEQAVRSICLYLVEAMERNYPGVLGDIDSEFLHDFRIAIRRTRSLLSQFKKYLPVEECRFFQEEFKWLGSLTGPVRDLDVYLLRKEQYRSVLPSQLHGPLEEFFKDLSQERNEKVAMMKRDLVSARHHDLLTDWKAFLLDGDLLQKGRSHQGHCLPAAMKIIRKRYEKILKSGGKITDRSPDKDLHRLRIQGKKLRYLLEFFHSFFKEEEFEVFHKQMKKLQNNLGDFNDISVQFEMLEEYREKLTGRSKRSIDIAAAIGGLITHLAEKQQLVRRKFEQCFNEFAGEHNGKRFYDILS